MALKVVLQNRNQVSIEIIFNRFSVRSFRNLSLSSQKVLLPKYLVLQHCSQTLQSESSQLKGSKTTIEQRPLALIFSWMFAQDNHLDKFRQLWFRRGFDVLTVRTSALASLMPYAPIGSKVMAKNLLTVMSKLNHQYDEVIVHAFSLGSYQFGQTLVEMRAQNEYLNVSNSIKGVILDSAIFKKDIAPGLSKVVTKNIILQSMFKSSINAYLKLTKSITSEDYEKAEQEVIMCFNKHPGLIFNSKDDYISSVEKMEELVKIWVKSGLKVQYKCWDESSHVLHYKNHPKEYEEELDAFLKSLSLRTNRLS